MPSRLEAVVAVNDLVVLNDLTVIAVEASEVDVVVAIAEVVKVVDAKVAVAGVPEAGQMR